MKRPINLIRDILQSDDLTVGEKKEALGCVVYNFPGYQDAPANEIEAEYRANILQPQVGRARIKQENL